MDDALQGFDFNKGSISEDGLDSNTDDSTVSQDHRVVRGGQKKPIRLGDEDSISTFGGRSKEPILSPPKLKQSRTARISRSEDTSVISGISTATMETINTLCKETNQKFDTFRKENAAIRGQNSDLQEQL